MAKTLLLNCYAILYPKYFMMGAKLYNDINLGLYAPFDFQAEALYIHHLLVFHVSY